MLTLEKYKKAIDFDELIQTSIECSKNVSWKDSVQSFLHDRINRITELTQKLNSGKYKIQKYTIFHIHDPKPRCIKATRFVDRVLQRSLCNNGLYNAFVKSFIYDNVACQKNKGSLFAIKRMKYHMKKYFKKYGDNKGFYIKLDIKHYFDSIPHSILKKKVKNTLKEPNFTARVFEIIDSFDDERSKNEIINDKFGKRGLGLGSQCSQLMALLYLDEIDHYIKEQLKIKFYVRYMDDMIMVTRNKEDALKVFKILETKLNDIGLQLNPKSKIGRLEDNIPFLKIKFKLSKSGKIRLKMFQKTFNKEIRRLYSYRKLYKTGKIGLKELIQHGNTWYGFAKYRCSGGQIKYIKQLVKNIFNECNTEHIPLLWEKYPELPFKYK